MLSPKGLAADEVGVFRATEMQVESGPVGRETIHFVAPPPDCVEGQVHGFLLWFVALDVGDWLITSALSHLIFVTIHPFADGNGRISRAIADLLLARDVQNEIPVSMTRQILAERQKYYALLERTQRNGLDVTEWLLWFLGCYERAALHTLDVIAEVQRANRIFVRAAQRGIRRTPGRRPARLPRSVRWPDKPLKVRTDGQSFERHRAARPCGPRRKKDP